MMIELKVGNILEILKHSRLPILKCSTEEEFWHKLFCNSEDRKELLKWALSQFSEKYSADIQNSEDIEHELLRKLIVLGFVENSAKWNFLKGQMEEGEQMKIYKRLFRALELIQLTDDNGLCSNNLDNNHLQNEEIAHKKQLFAGSKGNHRRKPTQDFDLVQAKKTLNVCDDILESVQKIEVSELEELKFNGGINPTTEVNMGSNLEQTFDLTSLSFFKSPKMPYAKPYLVELNSTVVGELYSSLQRLSNIIEP